MHEKLREAQALLRHQLRLGDVAEIFDRALTLLLADLRKARCAATSVSNLQLRCRAHIRFEAQRWSGPGEEDLFREASPIYGGRVRARVTGLQAVDMTR
jgi:hypothetical protein